VLAPHENLSFATIYRVNSLFAKHQNLVEPHSVILEGNMGLMGR